MKENDEVLASRGLERLRVLGAPVDLTTMNDAVERALDLAKCKDKTSFVVAVNPEKTFAIRKNADVARLAERADLAIPDGVGVVWAARLLSGKRLERTPGADLAQEICRRSGERDVKIFLFGAKEEVNAKAVERLRERFPDVKIVGRRDGYVKKEEMDGLVKEIVASGADVLFVALGSPRQERWMNEFGDRTNVGLCMGVGGTIDAIAGKVKRAPIFWQKINLEWFYRLLKQPSRLWRCRLLVFFAFQVLGEYWTRRVFRRRKKSATTEPRNG